MTIRYRFRSFDHAEPPDQLLEDIFPSGAGSGPLLTDGGIKAPWVSVVFYLRALGVKSLLIQEGVRDPDFLEEHHAFYAKQHRQVARTCVRVHAFSSEMASIPQTDADKLLLIDELSRATPSPYLGFVTVRPLRHAPVGATILARLPWQMTTVADDFPVHIAGNDFSVIGAPFLQQDNAVGACAQASIWMALRTLRKRVGNAAFSPAELTVAATRYIASDRVFPGRQGLTLEQMLEAVRFAGHDPLNLAVVRGNGANIIDAVAPYIESGLPVITLLIAPSGGHAVVSIGLVQGGAPRPGTVRSYTENGITVSYVSATSWTLSLTIHNDNTGPYIPLPSGDPKGSDYCLEQVSGLIVPLPDSVFSTAAEVEILALRALIMACIWHAAAADVKAQLPGIEFVLRPYLCPRHAFRRWARDAEYLDSHASLIYRTCELPRYVWIVEIHDKSLYDPTDSGKRSRCGEIVLDASADALHGDSLLFVRTVAHLWPTIKSFTGLLLIEDGTDAVKSVALASGDLCKPMFLPWSV